MHVVMQAQDSISIEFAKLYNQLREEHGLQTLDYSSELEAFAIERLRVSVEGTKECYAFGNWKELCPTKDMHFKFIPMAQIHNAKDDMEIYVVTENMAYDGEFTYSTIPLQRKPKPTMLMKVCRFFNSLISTENEITIEYSDTTKQYKLYEYKVNQYKPKKQSEIARYFFHDWLNSHGHKVNFMIPDITHFAVAYMRIRPNGNPYIQAVWIGGRKKKK